MKKNITITIDGFSGTGKGTTAKGVAKALGLIYLDTGAMYRATVLYAKQNNLLHKDEHIRASILDEITISFEDIDGLQHTFLNGKDVEDEIRKTDLLLHMKPIVNSALVRKKMVSLQQSFGNDGGIVCDGRDAGTHIFPDADLKVFLICDVDVRVKRRCDQLKQEGKEVDMESLKQQMQFRDQNDYLGPNAVNKKAENAKTLDTSKLSIQEQIEVVIDRANHIFTTS